MKRLLMIVLVLLSTITITHSQYNVKSPNSFSKANIEIGEQITYSVFYQEKTVISESAIRFEFLQAPPIGNHLKVIRSSQKEINETWNPVLKRKSSIANHCNELTIEMQETNFPRRTINLVFRAYNDGIAFRTEFVGPDNKHSYVMTEEQTMFNFQKDYDCWAANHGSFRSSQENEYFKRKLSDINAQMVIGLPMTLKIADDCYAAITEAQITDYAGMYLKLNPSASGLSLLSKLSPLPKEPENGIKVNFKFPHKTPWRVIILGTSPGQLIESEIIQNLNDPCAIKDPSWIKPGISAWDHWWSGEVKMDNETNKKYIDLASEMGWPYQLIDWQWYGPFNTPEANITKPAPQIDMPGIIAYAKSKNVKCWVWLYSSDVTRSDWDKACATYESWGIAGVKIDFMDSDDQEMVNWYRRVVSTAAKYHLMVDFHGAYKPDGFHQTYPNLVTREGVLGNEYNKWS